MINEQFRFALYHPPAAFKATGEDVCTYLQGQFTNDLQKAVGNAVYGLWLNQKGRVLADSFVLRLAEQEFFLVSLTSSAALIQQRLEQYIIADDVALQDETKKMHGLVIYGPGSGEALRAWCGAIPASGRFLAVNDCLVFAGRRAEGEIFEIIGSALALTELAGRLRGGNGVEAGAEEIEFARIQSGIPAVPQDIGPHDLPHEGGLENTAVSYTKGCYLGQEVMARLKSMGQIRRKLFVVAGREVRPGPQAPLYQAEKKVGEIRSVASSGDEFVALAMLSLLPLDRAAGLGTGANLPATLRLVSP